MLFAQVLRKGTIKSLFCSFSFNTCDLRSCKSSYLWRNVILLERGTV